MQTFDAIGSTATAALPADFRADALTGARVVGTYAAAGTATNRVGGPSLATNAANGIYNFGSGTTAPNGGTDRAIGFLSSASATQSGNLYAQLANNTATALSGLQIAYNVEKYRGGSNTAGFRIQLFSSPDGVTWTSAGNDFLTSFPADAGNNGFAAAPGAAVAVNRTLNVTVPVGGTIYLAWNYSVASGTVTSNAQALAVDDINITGIPGDPPVTDDAPAVTLTAPANGSVNVPVGSEIAVTFSESVTAAAGTFALECPAGAPQTFTQAASPSTVITLQPTAPLPYSTTCTVTIAAAGISDVDAIDPPDTLAAPYTFSFTTADPPPPAATNVIINEIDSDQVGTDAAEFVELFDGGVGHTPLDGLVVVFYNGSNDGSYAAFDLDGFETNASGYFILGNAGVAGAGITFGGNSLQNGQDAVALYAGNATDFPAGTLVTTANLRDAIVYDNGQADDAGLLVLLNAGEPQVNESGGGSGTTQSLQRCPNGAGGARNTSTYLQGTPTPNGVNACPPPPTPSNSVIVISQIYGGGGNNGAAYQNDYVELYNRGTTTVDIGGWSLQYAAATGGFSDFNLQPLGGTIGPGEYYLIQLATNGEIGAPLPQPNIVGQINMSGTSGKVALVNSFDALVGNCPLIDPHVMDFVGYGAADCAEGGATAPAPSVTTAVLRQGAGSVDTDRNASDFLAGTPLPRRTAPIVELGPRVLRTDPRTTGVNAPRDATVAVTFTEPVTVLGAWFDISCSLTGQHNSATFGIDGLTHHITPNVNFTAGETCTVTIFKGQVFDEDLDDSGPNTDTLEANHVWSFTVATGTAPPYAASVHLTMGNPSGATASIGDVNNYLMEKPEFALSYNRDFGRPNWVSWHLSDEWVGTLPRVDTFRADPAVPPDWYRVESFDFSGSGFDRGHMVPNADRDKETSIPINQATFLMSNMIAQAPDNNQGPWANFENYLRTLLTTDEIYIVAGGAGIGGTGSNGTPSTTIADGHVTVPSHTWKAALVLTRDGGNDAMRVTCSTRTIAVIMPNVQGIRNDAWESYLASVDAVEALTGYNLFSNLPPAVQQCVEQGINGNNAKNAPIFTNLAPSTVELGAAEVLISGTIAREVVAGAEGVTRVVPPGTVAVTLNGVTVNAPIGPDGRFTATLPGGALTLANSPYVAGFSYAGDANFEAASATSLLQVVDTTGPTIVGLSATPDTLGPPNHKLFDVRLNYSATDLGNAPSCALSVTSNESANGLGDGNTSIDWRVLDATHVQLRAERSGLGNGRQYFVKVTCTDAAGNASSATTTVSVPK